MNIHLFPDSLRILLVQNPENDAILVDRVFAWTADMNCSLAKASTIQDALDSLGESDYDIALLDACNMEELKTIQHLAPKLPVVILTDPAGEEAALLAIEHGAQDYLLKEEINGQTIRRSIQFAIQRKRFELMLVLQANSDPLTGLANRAIFEIRLDAALERVKRSGERIAVLFLDLNRFKSVNDNYGHHCGDKLLQEFARRLKLSVRPYDSISRFGGDEFALLIDDVKQVRDCAKIARKIIALMSKPFILGDNTMNIGVSIGIASLNAEDTLSREALMQYADQAMYRAKKSGKSDYRFHEPEIVPQKQLLANF